jgi:hypothetical protein
MTHMVEGWAVQYRRNRKGCRWKFWQSNLTVGFFSVEELTKDREEVLQRVFDYQTRIVRVRQTTEVIDE